MPFNSAFLSNTPVLMTITARPSDGWQCNRRIRNYFTRVESLCDARSVHNILAYAFHVARKYPFFIRCIYFLYIEEKCFLCEINIALKMRSAKINFLRTVCATQSYVCFFFLRYQIFYINKLSVWELRHCCDIFCRYDQCVYMENNDWGAIHVIRVELLGCRIDQSSDLTNVFSDQFAVYFYSLPNI